MPNFTLTVVTSLVVVPVLVFGLLPHVYAKNSKALNPDHVSINILPSKVFSNSWKNVETITSHDLGEDALFQDFNKQNSAYIDIFNLIPSTEGQSSGSSGQESLSDYQVPPDTADGTNDVIKIETVSESVDIPAEVVAPESSPEQAEPAVVGSAPEVVPEPEVEESPEPVGESTSEADPVAIFTPLLYSVFNLANTPFRLAVAETIESTNEIAAPVAEPVPEEVVEEITLPTIEPAIEAAVPTESEQLIESVSNEEANTNETDTPTEQFSEVQVDSVNTKPQKNSVNSPYSITLHGFDVPALSSGQFVDNLQLRLSLAGQYNVVGDEPLPSLRVSYSFDTFSGEAGSILLEDEFSNTINGGYYLIPFPQISDPALLSSLSITLTFDGNLDRLDSLFVDAAWLEVSTVVYDKKLLAERSGLDEMLKHLKPTNLMEFLSNEIDFTRDELPHFNLRYTSQRNFIVQAFRSLFSDNFAIVKDVSFKHNGTAFVDVTPQVSITSDGLISIAMTEEDKENLKPGIYTVEVEVDEGGVVSIDTFEFQWGLLSINTNQTEYGNAEEVRISMAALASDGSTLCSAKLNLYITDPLGFISTVPVVSSGKCEGDNVVDVPDYSALFITDSFGEYEMYLERVNNSGDVLSHVTETFLVVPNQEIVIERNGPTRIFPPAPYVVDLSVHALKRAFTGELIERVPASFEIFNTDAEIREHADYTELVWDMSLLNETTESVSYEFDAPDISPFLFNLGRAKLVTMEESEVTTEVPIVPTIVPSDASSTDALSEVSATNTPTTELVTTTVTNEVIVFEEHRQWQIASDALQPNVPNLNDTPSFDNILSTTTTPEIGGFAATDPDGDIVHYEFQIDDNFDFSSPATTTYSYNYPGDAGWSAATFASGATTTYTIQAADALTEGVTYWWRIRAKDPTDTDTYSSYSATRSFTVDTNISKTEWYQTIGRQFGRGTLVSVATTTGEVALATGLGPVPVVQSFTSNTALTTGASITLTKPSGVEVGDLLLIIVGNDDATANAQWNNTTLKPTGFTLINESGNATADTHTGAFYRVADGTEGATVNVPSQANSDYWGYYIRVTGADKTTPINVTGADYNAAVNALSHNIPGVNTTGINTLAFYAVSGDGGDTAPFTVAGAGWTESSEIQAGTGFANSAGAWGTRTMSAAGATGNATVGMASSDGASGFQFALTPAPITSGTVMSPEIDFDWVAGETDWGDVSWDVTEPTGTDTFLRLYYTSVTACDTIIPDVDLLGNSIGFDVTSSGMVIASLSTSTYNRICLNMTLDKGTGTTSPILNDWNVSWELPNQSPSIPVFEYVPAFDNLFATATPRLGGFVSSDYENESVEYEFTIDNDPDFSSPVLIKQSSNYPTDAGWSAATFASGATTTYTIQAADALTNGVTYWWRVRARDPLGSNTWSPYSTVWSATIDTGLEEIGWHQTLGLQFYRGTLSNLSTTTGGVELTVLSSGIATTTDDFESLADANTTFVNTTIWKQASISADDGNWQAETTRTASNNTGPDAASSGTVFIYTEASNGGACNNTVANNNCAIEADIEDYTLDSINFDYHMFGANIGTLSLDVYNGASWTTVWSRTGVQSVDALDWKNSGHVDLSSYKDTTTAIRFLADGDGGGWGGDMALDNIRIGTSTLSSGIIISPEIDFGWVPGQTDWGLVDWSVTEPAGTYSKLRVYYTSATACDTIIPDVDLPGNSIGFSSGDAPLFIDSLSTTTYTKICLQETLGQGSGGSSPILNDWSVKWIIPNQVPYAPLLAETPAFDSEKTTSDTPVFGGFAATDYENDNMEYELTIDSDPSFGSPDLTKRSSNYPTDAGWTATDFTAGATTTYTIQPSDSLTEGTTYWWRIRARDPLGTNTWSDYSEARSLTISNSISVPQWFQTTDRQFETDLSLINATSTGANGVKIENVSNSTITLLDNWSTGNTKTISEGNDRLLVVSITSEDSSINSNINTVTYGGQALTEIYDQQIGTGFSNGAWVGYLDEAGIANAVGTTITPTWVGGPPSNGILYASAVFSNVNQDIPVRDSSANALTTGQNITPAASINVQSGDMMLYITETATGLTHTAATGYTEGTEQDTGGSGFVTASAYKAITADGAEYPEAQWSGTGNRLLMIAVDLIPSAAQGSIMSSEIDFDSVSGQNNWGEIVWHVTEPVGSDTLLRVYYTSATACDTIIPDGALAGNAAGFSSGGSPLDISSLSTSTYNRICLNATLNKGISATSPTLDDWAVSWQLSPVFEQKGFWWYANTNAVTPTDTWPVGATAGELVENQPISSAYPTKTGDVLRLRMGVGVTSVNATGDQFKLQYAAGLACGPGLTWYDVAPIGSTTALWRGYNNAAVSDGVTLPTAILSGTDVLETYEEENNSTALPNNINSGQYGEWDWVLENRAESGTSYCFRMVTPDGNRFKTYTDYPKLVTNQSPSIVSIDTPFDNEKLADTTPAFVFTGVDPEGNLIDYEIEIDNDSDFSSVVVDHNSIINSTYFENLVTISDKSPFNDSEKIRYIIPSTLSNNTTYWWRVRAKDTEASTNYGEWSTPRSFTVDTSVTLTTWFQTTEAQFDTDTLEGTDATASDLVTFALGSTVGTTTSTGIDFDDVTYGNSWGTFSFNETGAANDILYHIEYFTGSIWTLIPDSALAGNAAGYDTSPVDLIDLDTETYNQIRIRANFNNGSPTLTDWTISWGERVSVPTHLLLFDNEKVDTTTPTFTFLSTDPQDEDLEYEFSWSTDNTFATGSTTVNSSTSAGFLNLDNGADVTPFFSGDTISYTMQSALTNGVTYWWRLRARDPNGGNSYSFWSDPWSFTVDVTATTSTWYQTTQEQFDTDILSSLISSPADSVSTIPAGVTAYNFSGVTNPSASHVARDFQVTVNPPTDPPTVDAIDTITILGTSASTPNLRSGIAGYASDAEATNAQYTSISASDNNRWTITDPGGANNAVFWAEIHIAEDPSNISQIDLLLEGYQGGTPVGTDKAWFGIWRPGAATPYWQMLSASQQTSDFNYTGSISSNISDYFDGNNNIHLIFFNEDTSDSLLVDYVSATITTNTAETGTITGTPLDFDDGSGPAWGQMYWNDSEPGGSSINYQVEYLNGVGVWELIPDVVLAGNSTGFTTSPTDLKFLNTTTYNEIRPVGNLVCNGISNCPTLNDWSIEWSRGFTVSGSAYEYDGVTPVNSGTVAVAVNGVLQIGKTGTISGGVWTIDNVTYFAGDVVTVFVNGAADVDEAVAITKYDGTPDITGMRLQKRHLSIGSNDNSAITNVNIGHYDVAEDEDIFYSVSIGNDLTVCADVSCSDAGLVVLANNTYSPTSGADLNTHDFTNYGTVTLSNSTWRLSGSYDNNATSTMGASTVIMTATSTSETVDSTGAIVTSFNNLTFGETSGTATWTLSSPLDVNGALKIDYGTLSRGTESISVAGALTTGASGFWTGIGTTTIDGVNPTNWTDNNATKQNIGNVVVDGSSKVLVLQSDTAMQSLTIGANDIFDLNNKTATVYENWNNGNTFTPRLGTVVFAATTAGRTITAGASSFYNLTFNGVGGSWSFINPTLSVLNDIQVATGTVTMPTGTTTIAGSFDATGGTFAHNNGTMYFTSGSAETITFDGGLFTNGAYNMSFNGAGSWTITDTNATSSNDVIVKSGTLNFPAGVMAIGGTLVDSGGAYVGGTGKVLFYSSVAEVLTAGGSSFNDVVFEGTGSWSFNDTNVDTNGDLFVQQGTLTLPNGIFTVGGSYNNISTVVPGTGTLTFDSTNGGELVNFGNSVLNNVIFDGVGGGWTVTAPATTTNNFSLINGDNWTLASGQVLSVGGVFTNNVANASTTWTGSTLSLEGGDYTINTKTSSGDNYETLRVAAEARIALWNSVAATYAIDATGSLYSQDHNAVNGDLYIFGNYTNTNGIDYWSYATDFDGVSLSGGNERKANVKFAAGATADFASSSVNIIGSASASTTISNQGSGTYIINISAGTTTAQYYEFSDLGSTGVSLLGGTIVPLLRDGSFTAGVAAGTAITLSSTTIDANPGKQILNVTFSTTTAIAAYNVTQTDGAPASFWWFRDGSGNLYSEAYDNDTGDPGSVRFDDSSLVITVAGTVYSDAGTTPIAGGTCDGGTAVVKVVVNGGSSYTGSCSNVDGTFSIPGVVVVGDPTLTVYLDNASGGEKGSVITRTPTSDILNLDIYTNRVVVRNEDVDALTIANLAVYDNSDDTDLQYVAATSTEPDTLTVLAGNELFIFASSTFAPGGDITLAANAAGNSYDGTLYVDNNASFVGSGTSTYTLGGRFVLDAGATFGAASTTVLMNATTTGKSITAPSLITFYDLSFNGTGGGWNLGADIQVDNDMTIVNGTVTGTGDITLPAGSLSGNGVLSLGGGTTTLMSSNTLGGTSAWTFYNLQLGNTFVVGTTTPAFTSTTTVAGQLVINSAHYLKAGSTNWDLTGAGGVFIENGTFIEDTSTIRYSGAGANVLSTQYYNLDINSGAGSQTYVASGLGIIVDNDLIIGGDASSLFDIGIDDPALDINGDLIIRGNGAIIASGNSPFTLAGSYINDGVFTGNGGTIKFDGAGAIGISAGLSSFSNVIIDATGDVVVDEDATTTDTWSLQNANSFTVSSGKTLAVGNVFFNELGGASTNWAGSVLRLYGGSNYNINATTTSDTYGTLEINDTTQIRMWNSDAATYSVPSTASLYSQDHAGVNGDLYIWGGYKLTAGSDNWSYSTDFDGTPLGGSERKVGVYLASDASVSVTGGSLAVFGTPSASTTIQNQGAGTYGLLIGDSASSSFQYYEVKNTNSSGLVLTGSAKVNKLSNGDFEVSQNGGTAITVGGTVITANPAKNFTLNRFALNGVASGFNVTATGTTVSSWRFANHYGDIAGEAFDVDPDGDPGYIAWDDSASLITVSGNVYSDEGSTVSTVCDGVTNNVTLRVAGITTYSTTCNAVTGAYSISNVSYGPTDSLVVFIDGESAKGTVVTKEPVSNINNLHIYENRVIVRHENTDPITIADMAVWDSSDDADIPFTAVDGGTDTLTLPANRKLLVWTGKEFEPTGDVTLAGGGAGTSYDGTLELQSNAIWTGLGIESLSVGGSMILNTNATYVASNGTTTFTTTGAARTIAVNENNFNNVAFTGSGSWSITDVNANFNGDVLISAGAVTLPTGTSTFNGSLINTAGSFNVNGGHSLFTGTGGKTITLGGSNLAEVEFAGNDYIFSDVNATTTDSLTITSGTITLPSGTLMVGGSFRNVGGVITHNTSELIITNAASATILASSSDLYGVTFNGGGNYAFEDVNLSLLDSLFINSGNVTLASGTLSIGGSFDAAGGTFNNATGTILFNSADAGEFIDAGASNFYNVQISSPTGGYTLVSNATTTNNFVLASAGTFSTQSGTTLKVLGVFQNTANGVNTSWSGSVLALDGANAYTVNTKLTGGDQYDTLVIGANSDIRLWNSAATTTSVDNYSSVYSQDNAGVNGSLYIYGDLHISTTTEYWSYATDFDGASLAGSERVVTVAHAANATTTVDGGTLNIVGVSGNQTTITNQGSGVYSMNVSSGLFSALHYKFRNLNTNGLNLSGTPTISSLSYGDYELVVNGGTLITLASSTLNANASLVIAGNRFATTTAITGYNVTLNDSTSNAWTFVAHTGNLDGEDYDVDGVDACGSIRWNDSACLLTQQTDYRWRNDDGGLGVPDSEWYNTNWNARKQVRVQNTDATTYINAAVQLFVTYDTDMQADFDDLRFTAADGITSIPYWVGSTTNSSMAEIWVKVSSLPSEDTTTVFMYYNNPTATTTSSSTQVFTAADDFEDGNISEYSGQTSLFSSNTNFAFDGSYGLDNNGNETSRANLGGIYRLDQTVSQGQTFRFLQYVDTSAGSGDETCVKFGVQSPGSSNNNYAVCLEQFGTDRMSLVKNAVDNDSSGTILASSTVSFSTGWYEVEVDWGTDNTMFVSLYNSAGSLVANTNATDSSYTSGGFGFTFWFHNGGWDSLSSRPTLTTEPVVLFGVEQTDGGATWKAAQNTAATFNLSDVARLRLLVENTGLAITNQKFLLEYASLGVAPSCEAISPANFEPVPTQASCGTSPVCMQSSTFITDGEPTVDLLVGASGNFAPGEARENPSNITGNINVDQNEYTELEYAVTPTSNVVDENLCFRVTDNGTDYDSYLQVARLSLRFDPVVGAITLNEGLDISLLPGTTTRVYATGTVSDLNGYADIATATTTFYRTNTPGGAACTPDNNNCYVSSTSGGKCQFINGLGSDITVECYADFYFHADPTDPGSTYETDEWFAYVEVEDVSGGYDGETSIAQELYALRAIDVRGLIDYGALEVNSDTGSYNASTSVLNQGNVAINLEITGTDLSDGLSSVIPANEQIFATSTFNYSGCTSCSSLSSTTPVAIDVDLGKPTADTPPVEDDVYWGIAIPFGVNSAPHQGVNVFTPISP